MKTFLITIFSIFASATFAHELTPQEALSNALTKFSNGASMAKGNASMSTLTLSYTENGTKAPLYYVFNKADGGFLIAGADSRSNGLLGYTDKGSFSVAKSNPAFQSWLSECTSALQWLSEQPESSYSVQDVESEDISSVEPLLGDIAWNQSAPYNILCPKRTSEGDTDYAPTGCAATATAQIMRYYQWPLKGSGSHTNTNAEDGDCNKTVDFSQSTYDWANMKPTYTGTETDETATAVAKLMSDIGCALNMDYEYDGSGTNTINILQAITTYFGYDKSASYENRRFYSSEKWNELLRNELKNLRPILIGAYTAKEEGHAFIIDGYDTNGLYHVNWGWSGMSNGYFDINYMDSDMQGIGGSTSSCFNIEQQAIVNIKKDETGATTASPSLKMIYSIYYDSSTKQFSFLVSNYGLGTFSGEIGFILQDANGKTVATQSSTYTLAFGEYAEPTYTIPTNVSVKKNYTIAPYYKPSGSGNEMYAIPCPLTSPTHLGAYYPSGSSKLSWGASATELPDLTASDIKITRNYTGYAPKFQLTVNNSKSVDAEYNEPIYTYISKTVRKGSKTTTTIYCMGVTQVYLKPGETKTIDVECFNDYDTISYKDITDGSYNYSICYECMDGLYYLADEGTITMSTPAKSNVTYTEFSAPSTIAQGEKLTASFSAKNTGGFTVKDFSFVIYPESGKKSVGYLSAYGTDIAGNATTTVEFGSVISLSPGNYEYVFYEENGSTYTQIGKTGSFTITPPTAIYGIRESEDSNPAVIYDISGRRIRDINRSGIYIINGKKVLR